MLNWRAGKASTQTLRLPLVRVNVQRNDGKSNQTLQVKFSFASRVILIELNFTQLPLFETLPSLDLLVVTMIWQPAAVVSRIGPARAGVQRDWQRLRNRTRSQRQRSFAASRYRVPQRCRRRIQRSHAHAAHRAALPAIRHVVSRAQSRARRRLAGVELRAAG